MKTCSDCAEEVKDAARVCRYCGFRFPVPFDPARCPTCDSRTRPIYQGSDDIWCDNCETIIGDLKTGYDKSLLPSPRATAAGAAGGGLIAGGFITESGPDADGDGDIDGGVIDHLGDIL